LVTHCADLKSQTEQFNMNISEIEDTHEDEVRGLNVILGDVETQSNGNREGLRGSIDMVEIIKSLQRDVLIYKEDNERFMAA
jgi:hypothetical protein